MSDQPRIRINDKAYSAYVKACEHVGGWDRTKLASKALVVGLEVIALMDQKTAKYEQEAKQQAQQEVLNNLVAKQKETAS